MSSNHDHHGTRAVQRHCDVCVIGASAAGLAAALELGRRGWSVIVVDAGEPGGDPARREEIRGHGGEILNALATGVTPVENGDSRVGLSSGHSILARRVLDAADPAGELPDVDGLADDLAADARPPANEADWDHRYGGDRIWSGNPNGTLVAEVSGLPPGRALDVGAGEGGDALWLAERGWTVTASDISRLALDRIGAEAGRRGLRVELLHADANAAGPFGSAAFDLVSAQYASIPRAAEGRAVRNLLGAVAPGGVLLVVGHDLEPMRAPGHDRPFDPDAYVGVDDFAAALAGAPSWKVELHEKRPRPAGAASASHHVDDVVLRARRLQ